MDHNAYNMVDASMKEDGGVHEAVQLEYPLATQGDGEVRVQESAGASMIRPLVL